MNLARRQRRPRRNRRRVVEIDHLGGDARKVARGGFRQRLFLRRVTARAGELVHVGCLRTNVLPQARDYSPVPLWPLIPRCGGGLRAWVHPATIIARCEVTLRGPKQW